MALVCPVTHKMLHSLRDASLISGPLLTLALFDEFVQLRLADIVEPKTVINNRIGKFIVRIEQMFDCVEFTRVVDG